MKDTGVIILAGGRGTRMDSGIPKVLQMVADKPIIFWTLDLINSLKIKNVVVVTCHLEDVLKKTIDEAGYSVKYQSQVEPLGTAHAVKIGLKGLGSCKNVLVLFGDDSALFKSDSIRGLLETHIDSNSVMTATVLKRTQPTSVGALQLDEKNNVIDVVSKSEMEEMGITTNFILCGAIVFDYKWLANNITKVKKGKFKGEYPLPALFGILAKTNKYAKLYELKSELEWNSVNTPEELSDTDIKKRKNG